MLPGLSAILYNGSTVFRGPTSDFNTTFGLAFGAVLFLQFVSIKDFGFLGYLGKFFKFKEIYFGFKSSVGDGFMAIVDFFIGLLDIVGEFAKVVSLSLRLFGNMYAGDVLSTLILGSFAYVLPVTWSAMSLLSGVVQAIVFGSLVTSYYMLAAKEESVDLKSENSLVVQT
jgi:F-type H+-transporting ATPase subunit a